MKTTLVPSNDKQASIRNKYIEKLEGNGASLMLASAKL